MRSRQLLLAAAALAVATAPLAARADDDDLLSSVYTENGYELRKDERLFALFAALNTAGFARAEQARELPFPRFVNHPIREKLRVALLNAADKLRAPVDVFLDTHPVSLDTYVVATLALGDAPDFTAGEGFPKELAGLDKLLAEFAKNAKLDKLGRGLSSDYRSEFKRLREAVDAPFAGVRAAYRLKEEDAPPLVLMPTPLDAATIAYAKRAPDGSHVVIFGLPLPGRAVDLQPALKAYSALLAQEAVKGVAVEGVSEVADQLKAQSILAADVEGANLVRESLRAAVEGKLWAKDPAADTEAAFKRGLVFAREFQKALAEPAEAYPAEKGPFVTQVVMKVDLKKTAAELLKPVPAGKK